MSNTGITALLIDTVSIQQYIFSSNKLKENIGASYIIENLVYRKVLMDVLIKQFSGGFSGDWEKSTAFVMEKDASCKCEIGYIGGGNALILFREESTENWEDLVVTAFIRKYTMELLCRFPGLRTSFGKIDNFDWRGSGFSESRERLNKDLVRNKSLQFRNVTVTKHGIVSDCALSNEAQETDFRAIKNISFTSKVKLEASLLSQTVLNRKYAGQLGERYVFTEQLEHLGQPGDKGYIAVVHIDGNNIGQRFADCSDLAELRALSTALWELADSTMTKLIADIVNLFEEGLLKKENGFELAKYEPDENATNEEKSWKGRLQLPIRPLITAGDDFTFVCEGRLGVHLAEKLAELIGNGKVGGKPVSVCCGIAITKTKYPFYRAYKLAGELTDRAKQESRAEEGSSWLSFLVSSGGYSGTLEEIIDRQFTTPSGNILTMGSYRLGSQTGSMGHLKEAMKALILGETAWPRNKLMELRDALGKDEAYQNYFLAEAEARGLKLPKYAGNFSKEPLWYDHNKTPYYDIIELLNFYPKELLP